MTTLKLSEIVKAWEDGKAIQRYNGDGIWRDLNTSENPIPFWSSSVDYRVKPETIKYRVALVRFEAHHTTVTASDEGQVSNFERHESFVRWLTDWIEVEV